MNLIQTSVRALTHYLFTSKYLFTHYLFTSKCCHYLFTSKSLLLQHDLPEEKEDVFVTQAPGLWDVLKKRNNRWTKKELKNDEWVNESHQWPSMPLWVRPFINWKFRLRNCPFIFSLSLTKFIMMTEKELKSEIWIPFIQYGSETVLFILHHLPNSSHLVIRSANNH